MDGIAGGGELAEQLDRIEAEQLPVVELPLAPVVRIGRARSAAEQRWGHFQMVSKREFAGLMGVSTKTVERWMHAGLPFEKYGDARNSRVRIPLARARAWVQEGSR